MTLIEAKEYTRTQIQFNGHKSDGCTLVKDWIFTPACQVHDMLIRFNKATRKEADDLFLEYMLELAQGYPGYSFLAYVYYYAMRYVAIFFRGDFTLALGIHGFALVMLFLWWLS